MKSIATGLVLLLAFQVAAEPLQYSFKVLPKGHQCKEFRCFSLDQFKLLIEYDHELSTLRVESKLLNQRLELQTEMVVNFKRQLELSMDSLVILQGETRRLSKKWYETDKVLQECKYDSPLWPWVILGISGAALLAAVGIIVGVYASGGGK